VPTGNFGNVFAGYASQAMGLPISRFVAASNRNDILTSFFTDGTMTIGEVHPTLSPSMDIQVSSNSNASSSNCTSAAVRRWRDDQRFAAEGHRRARSPRQRQRLRRHWVGARVDDDETIATIRRVYAEQGMIIDPHTAVAVAAAARCGAPGDDPMVILATAHPAKFPDAVEQAIGVRPPCRASERPLDREERFVTLPNDAGGREGLRAATLRAGSLQP
jgi:threonine synthase